MLLAAAVATTAVLAPRPAQAQTTPNPPVCNRTPQVRDAIVAAISGVTNCSDVTSAHLTGIQDLDASATRLTALQAGDFNGMTGLRTLSLDHNQLTSLPAGIFDSLTGLRSLGLYNNQLTSLPAGIFDSLTGLRSLELYNNQLTSLRAGVFDSLTGLQRLWMWSNLIQQLPENVFSRLTLIEQIYIDTNRIDRLDETTFNGLTTLKVLDISGNRLIRLPKDLLDQPDALTDLRIQDNRITALDKDIFDGLSNLQVLWMDGNRLTALDADIFDGLSSLDTLWIGSHPNMTSLPADIFDGLSALKDLRMEGLSTRFVYPDGLLVGLENLETFHAGIDGEFTPNFQVNLVRTPGDETEAKLQVPVGAPFDMTFVVFATGDTPDYAGLTVVGRLTIETGATDSGVIQLPDRVDSNLPNFLNNDGSVIVFILSLDLPRPESEMCGPEWNRVPCYKGFGFWNSVAPPLSVQPEDVGIDSARIVIEIPNVESDYRIFYEIWERGQNDGLIFSGIDRPALSSLHTVELTDLTPGRSYNVLVWGLQSGVLSMYQNLAAGYLSIGRADFATPAQPPLDPPDIVPTFNGETLTWKVATSIQEFIADGAEDRGSLAYQVRFKKSADAMWSDWQDLETEPTENGSLTVPLYGLEGGVSYDVEFRRAITGLATYGRPEQDYTETVSLTILTFIPVPGVNRIEPTTPEVSVRAGDRIRLSADIYNSQDTLDNDDAENGEGAFERWQPELDWSSSGGGSFDEASGRRSIVYTAPSLPGLYTVTAEVGPPGLCRAHHPGVEEQDGDPCMAQFTIRVSREAEAPTPGPGPVNPAFMIPPRVTDDAGTAFSVFTPVEGGTFSGTGITVSARPGAVPDRAVLAVAATTSTTTAPPDSEFTLHGNVYDVIGMSRTGGAGFTRAMEYRLNEPLTACLQVPWDQLDNLSNITVVEIRSDGLVGPLTSNLRTADGTTAACGRFSRVPATLSLATRADATSDTAAVPTADATQQELPEAGGSSLTVTILAAVLLSGLATVAVAVAAAVAMRARRPANTRARE